MNNTAVAPQVDTPQIVVAPQVDTPSIGSSAMLVELRISQSLFRKKDTDASNEVTDQNFADKRAAVVNKNLLVGCAELTKIHKFTSHTRNSHVGMTLPWSDTGPRLLTTKGYFIYHPNITAKQTKFYSLCDDFYGVYPFEVSRAHARLGNLFDPKDYPPIEEVRKKFSLNVCYIPLPDAGDFRVDVGNEQKKILQDHYSEYYNKQLVSAMDDLWQRTYKVLSSMSERLDYEEEEEEYWTNPTDKNPRSKLKTRLVGRKTFRDSLVSNVTAVVELLSVCNVTNDSQMEAMRLDLEDVIRGITPDALREDSCLRAETKRAVDKVIKSLPTLGM